MASALEYAIHRVIREYDTAGERHLGIVKTYKTIYDVYRQLKDGAEHVDLRLPWNWFTHGPVMQYRYVSPDALQIGPSNQQSDGEAVFRPVSTGNLDAKNLPLDLRQLIDEQVAMSVSGFAKLKASQVTNKIYERYAPHPFELSFRKLARGFEQKDLDYDERDLALVNKVQSEFPFEEFPELVPLFVDWSAFMHMAIEENPKFLWDNPDIVKVFQKLYGSQMSLRYNANVEPLVPVWKKESDALREVVQLELSTKRWEFAPLSKVEGVTPLAAYREAVLEELNARAGIA